MTGKLLNIQHFCVDDGPGIRTTVFLKGCPLRCAWCHNPESQSPRGELLYRAEKCVACGVCSSVCTQEVHRFADGVHTLKRDGCRACGGCVETCLPGALELAGLDMSIPQVMEEVLLDRVFYRRSGGGVTLSGGEPLAQPAFTAALLQACREEGLHTCVETCGYGKTEDLLKISEYTDLFLFDYKLTDPDRHRAYTGVTNTGILKNLDALCLQGKAVILRCPMIPEVNLEPGHYDAIASLANQYPNIREIHLEPYHPLGVGKAMALAKPVVYDNPAFLEKGDLLKVQAYIGEKTAVPVKIL